MKTMHINDLLWKLTQGNPNAKLNVARFMSAYIIEDPETKLQWTSSPLGRHSDKFKPSYPGELGSFQYRNDDSRWSYDYMTLKSFCLYYSVTMPQQPMLAIATSEFGKEVLNA